MINASNHQAKATRRLAKSAKAKSTSPSLHDTSILKHLNLRIRRNRRIPRHRLVALPHGPHPLQIPQLHIPRSPRTHTPRTRRRVVTERILIPWWCLGSGRTAKDLLLRVAGREVVGVELAEDDCAEDRVEDGEKEPDPFLSSESADAEE